MAVTSRSAYSFLSAGARFPLWLTMHRPVSPAIWAKRSGVWLVENPGMASSLSMVPPVYPSPRPLILATVTPQAAASGPAINVVLSPTPPVLCLSAFRPGIRDRSAISPEWVMASVSSAVSRSSIPCMQIAMSSAAV